MRQLTLPDLVLMANETTALMDRTMAPIRDLISRYEVVIAIWQDWSQPEGIATRIIKGLPVVQEAANSVQDYQCKLTALKCVSAEQAEGLALVFGDRPN